MTQKNFGATIRALREAQQISLRKFADKVGISPTYLSKIERDEFPPPGEETVKKFAEALNQDTDELLALAGKVSSDLPAIIQQKVNASESCGARVDIHTIAVTPQNRNAILAMKGHYENWKCPPAGFMWLSKRPPQKIYEQNGAARFRLEAKASPDGAGLEITPELESVDVEGMLGKLLKTFFIGPFIRDILIHRIMQSVNAANLKRTFPPALAEFKPQMQAARFTDIGGGKLGLSVNMTLHVNKAQAGGLLRRIVEQAR